MMPSCISDWREKCIAKNAYFLDILFKFYTFMPLMNSMMNTEATESRRHDRFFVAQVDGKETLFALHSDHSICIAQTTQSVTLESAETLLAELRGLAA
jgi:hypothetical protein